MYFQKKTKIVYLCFLKLIAMLIDLGEENSILSQFIAEIRDEKIQRDRMRFRRNLERIGEIFAYEISKQFKYKD
jgi:uracil phosphoribosyltransferase